MKLFTKKLNKNSFSWIKDLWSVFEWNFQFFIEKFLLRNSVLLRFFSISSDFSKYRFQTFELLKNSFSYRIYILQVPIKIWIWIIYLYSLKFYIWTIYSLSCLPMERRIKRIFAQRDILMTCQVQFLQQKRVMRE